MFDKGCRRLFNREKTNRTVSGMRRTWSIVVVYGSAVDRAQAVKVCDHLVERFWAQCEFAVEWWGMIENPELATAAVEKAAQADLLIFAAQELPVSILEWVESWLKLRGERDGALINLLRGDEAAESHVYLRHAAHRGGMDYLTHEPETICWAFPESPESYTSRAHQISSVLDEMLKTQRVPPQLSEL